MIKFYSHSEKLVAKKTRQSPRYLRKSDIDSIFKRVQFAIHPTVLQELCDICHSTSYSGPLDDGILPTGWKIGRVSSSKRATGIHLQTTGQ